MVLEPVLVQRVRVAMRCVKHGQSDEGNAAKCRNSACYRCTFIRHYATVGIYRRSSNRLPTWQLTAVRKCAWRIILQATFLVFEILHECYMTCTTVIENIKKDRHLKAVNEVRLAQLEPTQTIVAMPVQEIWC